MTALVEHRIFLQDVLERQSARRQVVDATHTFPKQVPLSHIPEAGPSKPSTASKANVINYVPEEETVRNDYTRWYGTSGEWGSNYVLGAGDDEICEEYPALKRLMNLKSSLLDAHSHPPFYAQLPAREDLSILGNQRFDVILITPSADWGDTMNLPIRNLSADPGFVFLWVGKGSEEGLEKGRECFAKWGFRRAEDIVWVKTNKASSQALEDGGDGLGGLFASQKEHCLMGIRGTVRRSTDSRFVHCNVDTDVMIWENQGEAHYPPYLQTLVENFCLGTRRLHIYGTPSTARRGWVTVGQAPPEASIPFDPASYTSSVFHSEDGRPTLPYHPEIDNLRPKSPQRKSRPLPGTSGGPSRTSTPNSGVGGGGRGAPRMQPFQQQQVPPWMQAQMQAQMMAQMQMQALQAQMQAGMMFNPHMGMPGMPMMGGMMPDMMGMGMQPMQGQGFPQGFDPQMAQGNFGYQQDYQSFQQYPQGWQDEYGNWHPS